MDEVDRDEVCVLIPTYNEETTIGEVVRGFRERGFEDVLVVDGHSTDDTRAVAEAAGARVELQTGHGRGGGKGEAVREGFDYVDKPYVLMLDGDGTYLPKDAETMLEPLFAGEAEHVIGNRFADLRPGAMPRLNQVGNRIINVGFGVFHGRNLTDILSGYRAFTMDSLRQMSLRSEGFGIETEMSVECLKHDIQTVVVPITYEARPDGSEANLRPFRDGGIIFMTLYRRAKTHNPLFYFGSVGLLSLVAGVGIGAYVGYEWFVQTPPVSHEALTVVSAAFLLLGVQLFIFGVLSDLIVTLHSEERTRIDRIEDKLDEQLENRTPRASNELERKQ